MTEGYIDPFLKTITFARGGRPLVRLHYYATHPQSFYLDGRISIDFPGMARERLQEIENTPQIYFTGSLAARLTVSVPSTSRSYNAHAPLLPGATSFHRPMRRARPFPASQHKRV